MDNWEATVIAQHNNINVVSLFSGLGGLDLGFVWEGFNIIWASDISSNATETYKLNFGHEAIRGDILNVSLNDIPKADVVIGGPPCQSFSLVGKRNPDDIRGQLVFRYLDVVKHLMPKVFVMENVPGLAASKINKKRLTDILIDEYTQLGYKVTRMDLVATDYLVPQKRKRIVLVGCKDWIPEKPDASLFAKECYNLDSNTFDISAKAAIADLGECTEKGKRSKYRDIEPSPFAQLMRYNSGFDVSLHEYPRMSKTDRLLVDHIPPGGNYFDVPDEIATGRILKFKKSGGRTTTYGRLHPDYPSYTINTYFRRPNVGSNFHFSEPRLITPREAMRFQSIPDHFEIVPCTQDERNALIGNAVPPLMARAIAWSVKKTMNKEVMHCISTDSEMI